MSPSGRAFAQGAAVAPPEDVLGEAGDQDVGHVKPEVRLTHQPAHHLHRELVVPGWHRCVRRENALLPHRLDVLRLDQLAVGFARPLIEQFGRQQAGMTFVHVEAREAVVAQRAQHPHPADAEHRLLAEAIPRVAAVKIVSQFPVPLRVLGQVTVQ